MENAKKTISRNLGKIIMKPSSKEKYRKNDKAFTRERKLTFSQAVIFMIRKSMKSLQNSLNEFFNEIDDNETTITASAYSQMRKNLSHKIFIDLNKDVIVDAIYSEDSEDSDIKLDYYKGFRVLGIDGSKIFLPNSEDIRSEFGTIKNKNQNGTYADYSAGLGSVMYDVLNNIAIDSILAPANSSEQKLAEDHIAVCSKNDLIIGDRGYPSYRLCGTILEKKSQFIFRCSRSSFKGAQRLFESELTENQVTLKRKDLSCKNDCDLPEEIPVRFVKVILDSGEIEVLMTSLLDSKKYPREDFKNLYWLRWGIETYFDILKNRLNLENFTGKSSESVRQDFFSTIMVSNYESIMTADAQEVLDLKKDNKYRQKINKSVSFNIIKNNVIELFHTYGNDADKLFEKMDKLFLMNPSPIRDKREFERNTSARKALGFHKRQKKVVF